MSGAKRWIIGYKGKAKPDEQALAKLGLRVVERHSHDDGGLFGAESDGPLTADVLDKVRKVPGVSYIEENQTYRTMPSS